jgi:hypothetical protein
MNKTLRVVPLVLVICAITLSAQVQPESSAPYALPRIQGKVILDGLSNEPAWAARSGGL